MSNLSDEVFDGAPSAPEPAPSPAPKKRPSTARVALSIVALVALVAGLVLVGFAIKGAVSPAPSASAETCSATDRIDIGGPADDFTITATEQTSNNLGRNGKSSTVKMPDAKAHYEGVNPQNGETLSGDVEYTPGSTTWYASSTDTSYIQISRCVDADGSVTAERKLQVFVLRDTTATADKTTTITSKKN